MRDADAWIGDLGFDAAEAAELLDEKRPADLYWAYLTARRRD